MATMTNPVMMNVTSNMAYTPAETIEVISRLGAKKGRGRPDKAFLGAMSAGCLLALAAGGSLIVTAIPWYNENAPGIPKLLCALIFPVALVLIMLTGGELFTGSTMITGVATLHGRLPVTKMLLHWFLCFWGNFAGCLFTLAIFIISAGVFDDEPFRGQVIKFVAHKQLDPTWAQIFIRGIGCNWLVCLAIFMGMQPKDIASKIVAMYMPIFVFVMLGFDHIAANFFFIPLGIWLGTPGVSIGLYVYKGIIPVALGNLIGGTVFCGGYYYYMFILGEPEIAIDGLYYVQRAEEGEMPVSVTTGRSLGDLESGNTTSTALKEGGSDEIRVA